MVGKLYRLVKLSSGDGYYHLKDKLEGRIFKKVKGGYSWYSWKIVGDSPTSKQTFYFFNDDGKTFPVFKEVNTNDG